MGVAYETQHKKLEITIHLFSETCIVAHLNNIPKTKEKGITEIDISY